MTTDPISHIAPRRSGFARGLLIGTLLGGGVVLIFTPRTGEEVREFAGEMAQLLVERVRGALTGEASYLRPDNRTTITPPA